MKNKNTFDGSAKNLSESISNPEGEKRTRDARSSASVDRQAKKKIESVMKLEQEAIHGRSTAEQIADKITKVVGNSLFIIVHGF